MMVAINKPHGLSSYAVVARVRALTGVKKVGHAGTLDPLADGVLVVAIGREATKQIDEVVAKEKEYVAEIFLGAYSTTDDSEGEKTVIDNFKQPSRTDIESLLPRFTGFIQQRPPQFSAIHVRGMRAYDLARKGTHVNLGLRSVEIKQIQLMEYAFPMLKISATTGPGVYIRSLARDIGEGLGCGAYIHTLRRTRVGSFTLDEAIPFASLDTYLAKA